MNNYCCKLVAVDALLNRVRCATVGAPNELGAYVVVPCLPFSFTRTLSHLGDRKGEKTWQFRETTEMPVPVLLFLGSDLVVECQRSFTGALTILVVLPLALWTIKLTANQSGVSFFNLSLVETLPRISEARMAYCPFSFSRSPDLAR